MTDEQKTTVKEYVTTLDSTVVAGDLLDIVVDLTADRVLLYLNETELDSKLERVVAQIAAANYHKVNNASGGVEKSISTVSDNGQSVSFTQSPMRYFSSAGDDELFSGFEKLLAAYRRIHVIA